MKRLILVIAAVMVVIGYIAAMLINPGMGTKYTTLVMPEVVPVHISDDLKEGLAPNKYIDVYVNHVVDGDTIEVTYKKKKYSVRFLCIDTPESVKSGVAVQPFGKEATKVTENLVLKKRVKLVFEKGLRDKYGRLLAHVILENGDFLNAILVRSGFARVEIVSPNSIYRDYFYSMQEKAIMEKSGLWGLPPDRQPFIRDDNGEYIPRYWAEKPAS